MILYLLRCFCREFRWTHVSLPRIADFQRVALKQVKSGEGLPFAIPIGPHEVDGFFDSLASHASVSDGASL
jgi:hypothetical protein